MKDAPNRDDFSPEDRYPSISLPKGGGAIRGIGEKFATNPVTGTATTTVPIRATAGRSGFGPELSLSYDSGSGNGPFGFGWSLQLPQIARKTDKRLPEYRDVEESDVFLLAGAEDLVAVLGDDMTRVEDTTAAPGFTIHFYRPRIEGLFARIERWTRDGDGDVHWRAISADDILTIYGKNDNSRIADPTDPRRIFTWLICESRDPHGNAIIYDYKSEDGTGAALELAHERNRGDRADLRRTANRYIKKIRYGNRTPLLDGAGERPVWLSNQQIDDGGWMFEVVFDYGEHDPSVPSPSDAGPWAFRPDAFSSYRAGFEVRTCRLCRRVLVFHHFPNEDGVGADCLVHSTSLSYAEDLPDGGVYTFLTAVTQAGHERSGDRYAEQTLPALEYHYTRPVIDDTVHELDAASLENLPVGLNDRDYRWVDLHGEGIPGILSEQAGSWFYKRNLSPLAEGRVELAPLELVATRPNLELARNRAHLQDLAGDGQLDVVVLGGSLPGFYEHDEAEGWHAFRPFAARLPYDPRDPNLRFIDLDGDGRADVLISEDNAFVCHASLAEDGFGAARRIAQELDEERGPHLVFADAAQSIHLADLSGDGLTDLVRIRNGEICYWPNLGHGRFGAKVTMDGAPLFDHVDQFDQRRIRLADIDGSGTVDILYLHRDGVRIYFNQSGNAWSEARTLGVAPRVDDIVTMMTADLLGNGTACLVWSSPAPGDAGRQLRYVDLMGGQKPHLLSRWVNQRGAETRVDYASSTRFYLQDKYAGKPWITRLAFPAHVVTRVETRDLISGNRLVSHYTYHHGYFDGEEREFRGFGMVEQLDTEELGAPNPVAPNFDSAWRVPPVLTKTWFHTGIHLGRERVSNYFAGLLDERDRGEYYREPGHGDVEARRDLLPDTVLPDDLSVDEEREACRALKGRMLRKEVYALDGSDKADTPYVVEEQNLTVVRVQARGPGRHAVFFVHPRESLELHYERNPHNPRVRHALTLAVDGYGNVLEEVAIAHGRSSPATDPALTDTDRAAQARSIITFTTNRFTNAITTSTHHRKPLPADSRTYELTGIAPAGGTARFTFDDLARNDFELFTSATEIPYEQLADGVSAQRRLIEHTRALYRKNDLTGLSALGEVESLALPGERYQLALTPGIIAQAFVRRQSGGTEQPLLGDPQSLLTGKAEDQGGYAFIDGGFWIPSGRVFYDPSANVDDPASTAAAELARARQGFFLPRKVPDPFGHSKIVDYDAHQLLVVRTLDPEGNTIVAQNDYRVVQPRLVTDPNRNRTAVAFDPLGMVVATAVMGKAGQALGDRLEGFERNLALADIQAFVANPTARAAALLGSATTRTVYDLHRFARSGQPPFTATFARETHHHEVGGNATRIQIEVSYSDGFAREIQKKVRAEPGRAPERGAPTLLASGDLAPGELVRDDDGRLVETAVTQRWVGSGRTVFNNKGKVVRQYEPFFSATQLFEPEPEMTDTGVSSVLFYDPVERVVATLHPNHTYEKVVFDAWTQITYDVNDTVAAHSEQTGDPRTDPDVAGYVRGYFDAQPVGWQTWYTQRIANQLGVAQRDAAQKAAVHANTPTVAHLDALGRQFVTIAHNRYIRADSTINEQNAARIELDVEGNPRAIRDAIVQDGDARGRVVMRQRFDMLGNRLQQTSMDAGARWLLGDATGKPIRSWDSREFERRMTYDRLRRPTAVYVREDGVERLAEHTVYGESVGDADNHRTRVHSVFDGAGVLIHEVYDFKGNLRTSRRELLGDYAASIDWRSNPPTTGGSFTAHTRYDALNRPIAATAPDGSIRHSTFNEANLLERVELTLPGASTATPFVRNIDYDAKGQRVHIVYGNDVVTRYEYDPLTFRLIRLQTTRSASADLTASQLFEDVGVVQDLWITHDPVGNPTQVEDAALRPVFYAGQQVERTSDYTYDALYRLIEARGREHIAQTSFDSSPPNGSDRDRPYIGIRADPNDLQALRSFTQQYHYDAAGNLEQLRHIAGAGSFTQYHDYLEASPLESGKTNNRLTQTRFGSSDSSVVPHTYDDHGNTRSMPRLADLQWDYADRLRQVDLGGGGTAYYSYDAFGQRMRKVIVSQTGGRRKELIYLGGFEIYREYTAADGDPELVRKSLHVMDDKQRIALVETLTTDEGQPVDVPVPVVRYQIANDLGSASVELDEFGALISYEEYHPYGTTAFQAGRSGAEVGQKRYRYTSKERDEETGFGYHGARHYAPWLGRWTSADPVGLADGPNVYAYARANPVRFFDPAGTECNERDTSTCSQQGTPPPPPPTTGTLVPFAAANDGNPPRDPPDPDPPAVARSPAQLFFDFSEAIRDSSLQFQLRGGLLAPEDQAPRYPVIGTDQIGSTLGRAFRVVWREHPQLRADVQHFGLSFLNQNLGGIVALGTMGVLASLTAAGGGEFWPLATITSAVPSLVPEVPFQLPQGPSSNSDDLRFRQGAFSLRSSTPIGTNEGSNPIGAFPHLQFRGQYFGHAITIGAGVNLRYLPDLTQLRVQESIGLDFNFARFDIGPYRASFDLSTRVNFYQQVDFLPEVRGTSLPTEGAAILRFEITEPPVRSRTPN